MTAEHSTLVAAWYRGAWWLWLLRPLEIVFRLLAWLRRALYKSGFLAVIKADKPLIVVGNITVGGTGKTPVVLALVEHLQSAGLRPGLVSRGYGARPGVFPRTVDKMSTAQDCGDEALLIFSRTGCPIVVAPGRNAAVCQLLEEFEVDLILSDDGLQHYAMGRDMEIAVLDQERGLGNGFCLPAGPLREPFGRLSSVDFLLYRGSEDPKQGVRYIPVALVNLKTGRQCPFSTASVQAEVHGVAGIGQPEQFFDSLKQHGFVVEAHSFSDHHEYHPQEFADLSDKPVIMTEKDAVKCREFCDANTWYLKIDAQIPQPLLQAVVQLARAGT